MSNLGYVIVELDPPADYALGANGQKTREVVALDAEIGQGQPPSRVGANDPIGPRAAAGLVRLDPHRNSYDLIRLQVLDRRRGATIDNSTRQVP